MKISWMSISGVMLTGEVEANLVPWIEALGVETAALLFEKFCGGYIYVGDGRKTQKVWSKYAAVIGEDGARALRASPEFQRTGRRVPLGDRFLCRYLRSQGLSVNEICRRARLTDTTVREHLLPDSEIGKRRARNGERLHKPSLINPWGAG